MLNKESRSGSVELFSDATLRELDRALWTYPFSEMTEERAKRVLAVCATSLLWAAGLIEEGSITFLDITIGASATLITGVALGLVVYTFFQWLISMLRDKKHWRLAVSGINETLTGEASDALTPATADLVDRQSRYTRYAPKIKVIEEQLAQIEQEYSKPIADAQATITRLDAVVSKAVAKSLTELALDEKESHIAWMRKLSDEYEDAIETLDSIQEEFRTRREVLRRKRQWYWARCKVKDETMRRVMALLSEKSSDRLSQVVRGGRRITRVGQALEVVPVMILAAAAAIWLGLRLVDLGMSPSLA